MPSTSNGKPSRESKPSKPLLVWRKNVQANEPVKWGAVDPSILRGAVDAVTMAGGAIMLGTTADGGAYSICILYQNDKVKMYPHTYQECEAALAETLQEFTDLML